MALPCLPAHSCRPSSSAFSPAVYTYLPSPSHTHNLTAASLLDQRKPARPALRIAAFHTASSSCPDISLYQVLHIPHTATPSEIKASYRRLARIYHPDVCIAATNSGNMNEDSTQIFLQIREAYDTLSDARNRAQYDLQLALQNLQVKLGSTRRSSSRIGRNWESDQCWC